ncbi:hypothetical protein MMC11_007331 [Xylographa trunciseda]|nr:hypothetical protein [Xylographa trunciseda]
MTGFTDCSTSKNRTCWLKGPHKEYNIKTDYENEVPVGVTRKYYLEASEMNITADGVVNPGGKVFNSSFPGPWIQACWGDELEITVQNNLPQNGTTIHWHGIRQLNQSAMDGVNGVTQCPIAPGQNFTYKFRAMQYGSSWYHSHYSLQYGDGLQGPMTIYGPSSDSYDAAIDPILMTDWAHISAFEAWTTGKTKADSILLNGMGQYVPPKLEGSHELKIDLLPKYTIHFKKGVRYLLRLINTSVDSTFIFSIDSHNISVIGMDFVPITPYNTTSVLIGIGQRYHVIVEANPNMASQDGNYWIRTVPAKGCGSFNGVPEKKTGILRYNALSTSDPTTTQNTFDEQCSDENYTNLSPILKWKVPETINSHHPFVAGFTKVKGPPYYPETEKNRWDLHHAPMWLDFGRPTLLHLSEDLEKNKPLVVVNGDWSKDSWVELTILGQDLPAKIPGVDKGRLVPRVAHPIHLHGHDFALLAQSDQAYNITYANSIIQRNNPPRRDVALLPLGGFLVIAFKSDNPGTWLMHCHIAWHASSGLALQIIENKANITIEAETRDEMSRTCREWDRWVYKGNHYKPLQDDSGI